MTKKLAADKHNGMTMGMASTMGMVGAFQTKQTTAKLKQTRRFVAPSNAPLVPLHRSDYVKFAQDAGEEFEKTSDRIGALAHAALLLQAGHALPPSVARWLTKGFYLYVSGSVSTLDEALSLNGSGKAQARRIAIERLQTESVLSAMQALHMMGASISEAAAMACQLRPHLAVTTAIDAYSRSGRGRSALAARKEARLEYWEQCMGLVDRLPDDGGDPADKLNPIRLGKAKIKRLYAKLSALNT